MKYSPYNIGKKLYNDGYGVSDIWSAVRKDSDMDEAWRGYIDAKAKDEQRQDQAALRSQLGYSRIGLNNK